MKHVIPIILVAAGCALGAEINVNSAAQLDNLLTSTAKPGDILWLRSGTYSGAFKARVSGTAARPIIVRAVPGDRVTLSGLSAVLEVKGSYLWFWGLEIVSEGRDRMSADVNTSWPTDIDVANGVVADSGEGIKFINCIVHDTRQGFSLWRAASTEVYGCIIYHNGWWAVSRGHGHNTYTQNETPGKLYKHNVVFGGYSMGFHAYGSSSAPLKNFTFDGNVFADNGWLQNRSEKNLLLGGVQTVQNCRVVNNHMYYRPGSTGCNLNIGFWPYGYGYQDIEVSGNRIVGGRLSFSGNGTATYRNNWIADVALYYPPAGVVNQPRPTSGLETFILPNEYDNTRAMIVVYNWGKAASVDVNVGSYRDYEIRDALNYFAPPVATGNTATVRLAMSGRTAAQPYGHNIQPPYAHTAPEFGVFVLQAKSSASPIPPRPPRNIQIVRRRKSNGIRKRPSHKPEDATVLA